MQIQSPDLLPCVPCAHKGPPQTEPVDLSTPKRPLGSNPQGAEAPPLSSHQLGRRPGSWDDRRIVWVVGRGRLVGIGAPTYEGFRFPAAIISHCVWLYYRFPLSLRGRLPT